MSGAPGDQAGDDAGGRPRDETRPPRATADAAGPKFPTDPKFSADSADSADEDASEQTGWSTFRRIAMSCPLPVFATDAVGRHVFVNPRWSELTGVDPDEALGWGWERAVHPQDLLTVTDQWGRARASSDGLWVRLRLLRPDGLHRAAILQAVPSAPGAGGPRFIGTLTPLPPLPLWEPPGDWADGPAPRPRLGSQDQSASPARLTGPAEAGAPAVPQPRTGQEPTRPAAARLDGPGADVPDGPRERDWDDGNAWEGPESDPAWWDDAAEPGDQFGNGPLHDSLFPDSPAGGELAAADLVADREDRAGQEDREHLRGRPRTDHLTWDVNRRRAAAPDGGDSWPSLPGPRVPPTLGSEWRAAIALHARAADGHPVTPSGHPAAGAGHGRADGPGARVGLGSGGGGRGHDRPDRLPPAECGCLYGELARAEAACRDRERWLTSLLAELPAAVLLADAHSQVVGVNQAYCDLFDLADAPVDLVGTDCRLLLRPRAGLVDDPAGFADRLDTLLRRRRTLRRETVMFADGRVFERSHLPLVSPDGYRGHLWLYVDVTDRRILDAEIEGLISEL